MARESVSTQIWKFSWSALVCRLSFLSPSTVRIGMSRFGPESTKLSFFSSTEMILSAVSGSSPLRCASSSPCASAADS